MTSGGRCGPDNCSSSTVTPAIVYFPPGTYVVSSPIIDYYFTMMIGDAVNLPTLKASPNFGGVGLGVIDGDKVCFSDFGRHVHEFLPEANVKLAESHLGPNQHLLPTGCQLHH